MFNVFLKLPNIDINYRVGLNAESIPYFAISQLGTEATILRFAVRVQEAVILDFGLVHDREERSGAESRAVGFYALVVRIRFVEPLLFR